MFFFWLFCLYFFETAAYQKINISTVLFLLFGTSTVAVFAIKAVIEKRHLLRSETVSMLFSLAGLILVFNVNPAQANAGTFFAVAPVSAMPSFSFWRRG